MDVFALQSDGSKRLLATGLDSREMIELQEQLRYTKPFGSGMRIMVRTDVQALFSFRTTGTEPEAVEGTRHSEVFVG